MTSMHFNVCILIYWKQLGRNYPFMYLFLNLSSYAGLIMQLQFTEGTDTVVLPQFIFHKMVDSDH